MASLEFVARCWGWAQGICEGSDRLSECDSSALEHRSDPSYAAPHRKHEWDKHGTCAAQVDALNSEKKYFGKSLDLYKQIDLNRCVDISLCRRPGAGPLSTPCVLRFGPERCGGLIPGVEPLTDL